MGVRIYPRTKDEAALETLAAVPAGTAARLRAIEAKHNLEGAKTFEERHSAEHALYEELYSPGNEDVNSYSGFLSFGYGRLRANPFSTGPDDYAGEFTDEQVPVILAANGIDVPDVALLGGLYYC